MRSSITFLLVAILAIITKISAHGLLTAVQGANGVVGTGFGVDESTPRDGTRRRPFQQDTSIIRDRDISRGRASSCGRTLQAGALNIPTEINKQMQRGNGVLPSVGPNGQVQVTIHQINGDGGGPYAADVDPTGTGDNFQPMQVVQNVPGRRGNSRDTQLVDHPVILQMPAGMQCTGGANGNMCLVRVRNPARAGPFGGCAAVQMDPPVAAVAPPPAAVPPAATVPAAVVPPAATVPAAVVPPAATVPAAVVPPATVPAAVPTEEAVEAEVRKRDFGEDLTDDDIEDAELEEEDEE